MEQNIIRNCRAAGEYPSLAGLCPDAHAARMLQTDFAGCVSETTAVMQYVSHRLTAKAQNAEVAEVLGCIARVEMKHMALIGEAITALGGSTTYYATRNGQPVPWQPDYVKYESDIPTMLQINIQGERAAIAQYRQTITLVNNSVLEALIIRIIQDEELHIQILTALLQSLNSCASETAFYSGQPRVQQPGSAFTGAGTGRMGVPLL